MKVRLKLVENLDKKLMFVKIIKTVTGLGLKESKDICDYLCNNKGKIFEIEVEDSFTDQNTGNSLSSLKYLKEELPNCGGEILINGGTEFERELKMLSLGIGNIEDYSSFIKEYSRMNSDFLNNILNKLKKEDLQKLINEIEL
jgi:hypothetical protein